MFKSVTLTLGFSRLIYYLASLEISNEFENQLFHFYHKYHWNFVTDWFCWSLWECCYLNNIKSSYLWTQMFLVLTSFSSLLWFSVFMYYIFLVKLVPTYFIHFDIIAHNFLKFHFWVHCWHVEIHLSFLCWFYSLELCLMHLLALIGFRVFCRFFRVFYI